MKLTCLVVVCLIFASTPAQAQKEETAETDPPSASATDRAIDKTREGLGDAALSPLEDLNLRRKDIPRNLAVLTTPYGLPASLNCDEISALVRDLNASLGEDWDTITVQPERTRSERIADGTSSATLGAVASEARGLIPFRGVVRTVTGARHYASRRDKAYALGAQRRAFLKGMGLAKGCPPPAAPVARTLSSRIIYHGDRPDRQ